MDEVEAGMNSSGDWWAGAAEEDAVRSLPLDALWGSAFVPPPPRPHFLDEHVAPDGLTTCDLCSWAWHERSSLFAVDASPDAGGEISWVLTLAIVSILSAAIGAVIMVTVLQCRNRLKNVGSQGVCSLCMSRSAPGSTEPSPNLSTRDKAVTSTPPTGTAPGGRVWSWLAARRPPPLSAPTASAENHYTLDEAYTTVGEALYAELDRESSSSPAYQNAAYSDPEAAPSTAPSSAYYSDLSCTTLPDRTYEAVGMVLGPMPTTAWDPGDIALRRQPGQRLASITETITVPSDYV